MPYDYTVMDQRNNFPTTVKALPKITDGFVWWRGELREVCEVHVTGRGQQMELMK